MTSTLRICAEAEKHNQELHEQTKELMRIHLDQGNEPTLTQEGLLELRKEGCINAMLLVENNFSENTENLVGYALYSPEFDMILGDYGIFLDQLFISPTFRGTGNARRLMKAICEEARKMSCKFIKLYFQKSLQVDKFYAHFGFKNITTAVPCLHFYEVYGHIEMKRYFDIDVTQLEPGFQRLTCSENVICANQNVNIWRLEGSNTSILYLVACKLPPIGRGKHIWQGKPEGNVVVIIKLAQGANMLPGLFTLITLKQTLLHHGITIESSPVDMWKAVSQFSTSSSENFSLCAFVEKPSVCGWLGKMVTFGNFTGDLNLIQTSILKDRIITWALQWGTLMGVNFEVMVPPGDSQNPLPTFLANMQIPDASLQRGWNIAILKESEFHQILHPTHETQLSIK